MPVQAQILEDRLLLTSDFVFDAGLESHEGFDLTLTNDGTQLLLLDSGDGLVVKAQSLSDNTGVVIVVGSNLDETLRLDASIGASFSVSFAGGAGIDELVGPGIDNTWEVTGNGVGTLNTHVSFQELENLTGGVDNQDTFVFGQNGALSGMVEGGDRGFDTVVFNGTYNTVGYHVTGSDSGVITLGEEVVEFDGMEPILITEAAEVFTYDGTIGDDVITLRDIPDANGVAMEIVGTGETIQFVNPTEKLVINGRLGEDEITVQSLDASFAADLQVYGNDGGPPELVSDANTDSIIFAGSINTHGGYLEAFAESISVADGVTLSTKDPIDVTAVDDIVFRARRIGTNVLENAAPATGLSKEVDINIGRNAKLEAGSIFLIAQAVDRTFSEIVGIDRLTTKFLINPVQEKVSNLTALPVKFLIKESHAKVTLQEGAQILADGAVGVYAKAIANATGKAHGNLVSIGYAQATAIAEVDIQAKTSINAGDAVVVTSDGDATASMTALTQRGTAFVINEDTSQYAGSLAVTFAESSSKVTMADEAEIISGKTANVRASGKLVSNADSTSGLFSNGNAVVAAGLELSKANIKTEVNGNITAKAGDGSVVKIEIDPTVEEGEIGYVDFENDMIYIGPHALETEDTINYSNRRGNDIPGLVDGQDYVIIA
ncbi:MAG: hypothetical protein KDA84_24710, partial [Planctomycetaceae bacterium]|nr:hypothetical protein [Planctomycetaceae bacterium]